MKQKILELQSCSDIENLIFAGCEIQQIVLTGIANHTNSKYYTVLYLEPISEGVFEKPIFEKEFE